MSNRLIFNLFFLYKIVVLLICNTLSFIIIFIQDRVSYIDFKKMNCPHQMKSTHNFVEDYLFKWIYV